RTAGTACRAKLLRPGFAVHVETDFESIAVETKDPEVAIPRFRTRDEADVDLVRVGFDIDVEDAFVGCFGRFRAKAVAVDQDSARRQRGGGHPLAVNFEMREGPRSFEGAQLFDVPAELWPAGEAGFPGDGGLGVREPERRLADLFLGHAVCGRQMLANRGDG